MIVEGIRIVQLSTPQPNKRMGTNKETATKTSDKNFLTSRMRMVLNITRPNIIAL